MFTPRAYLSFSQLTTFENSPREYASRYFYGEEQRVSENMSYGSQMAEGLEKEEATGDPLLDLMMARIPKFERMDMPVEDLQGAEVWFERDKRLVKVPILENVASKPSLGSIPLLAVPDSARSDFSAFKEYKTSIRRWTQRMADDSGQITFYTTAIWLLTKKIPQDIELVNVPVQYLEGGKLAPTGELVRLQTKRTLVDVIKMTRRMRTAWAGIQELYKKELL